MPKFNYDALRDHLAEMKADDWSTSFLEIESLLGFPLPSSARKFHTWWSNSATGRPGTPWREAGFRASVKLHEENVIFTRGLARQQSKRSLRAAARLNQPPPPDRNSIIADVRALYDQHGIEALSAPFLEKHLLLHRLRTFGLSQTKTVEAMGMAEEYAAWKARGSMYRGRFVPKRTFEQIVEEVRSIGAQQSSLPTMDWFRKNGHSGLISEIFRRGHTFEDVRAAIGDFSTSNFRTSRVGIRWRSHPEASLSDFLFARGITHRRGERYDDEYAKASGRHHGHYDIHFTTPDGREIDVEIWGGLDTLSGGRYSKVRAAKEAFRMGDTNFLGIEYLACLSDEKLTTILKPFIGIIDPFCFEKAHDPSIETSHWTDADALLETCRQLAAQQLDGVLPNEQWLRKRGKYADRAGPIYNTIAVRINQWLGGTRNARTLIGQAEHSTEDWTAEKAVAAWREFEATYGYTPTQIGKYKDKFPLDVIRRGPTIRAACARYGVLDEARRGKTARKVKWTPEILAAAWIEFEQRYGVPVNLSVGKSGVRYPRSQLNEASRIYSAARRLGLLDKLKASNPDHSRG